MKKLTALARVIDVFSTEPIEKLDDLLAAAQQIAKSRRQRNQPERTRRQKSSVISVDMSGIGNTPVSAYQEEARKEAKKS